MLKYLRQFGIFFCSAVLIFLYPLTAPAGTAVSAPEQGRQTLRVGYINYDGFIVQENGGYIDGYGVAFLDKISEYTGWRYEFYYNTWEECLNELERGTIDLVCCAQSRPDRRARFAYTEFPIGRESTFVYTNKGSNDIYYQDYEAMDGATAAVLKDSYQSDEFADFAKLKGFSYEALELDSVDEITDAVQSGRADLAVSGSLSRQTDLRIVDMLGMAPFYIITTKGNDEVLESLNDALRSIYSSSPYIVEELYYEYYGYNTVTEEPLLTREEAEYVKESAPLTVACIDGFYPLSYADPETGEPSGIFPDLARKIGEISGLEFILSAEPSGSRPEDLIKAGRADIAAGILFSQEKSRETGVQLTEIIMSQPSLVISNSGVNIFGLKDGVMALPCSYENADSLLPDEFQRFGIIFKENLEDCFTAVKEHEADLTIQNTHAANYFMQKRDFSTLAVTSMQSMEEKSCMMISREADRKLLSILNKSINSLGDNTINQIIMSHTVAQSYHDTLIDTMYFYRKQIIFLTALTAAIIVLAALMYRRHMHIMMELKEKKAYQLMAETDELTGMYNRKAFYERALRYMDERPVRRFQIIFFNAENFKVVNDLFGVQAGDGILIFLAGIIKEWTAEKGGVCSRFEGDHFVVCTEEDDEYAKEITDKIRSELKTYPIDMNVEVSCGIYHVHGRDKSINIMCDRAHIAVNSIKGNYARHVAVYDDSHREAIIHSQLIVSEMNRAMEERQFHVYLQPKFNMETEKIIGAEALVRWVHPERGILPPGDFIPIFEHNGFIGQLDLYMFEETCKVLRRWLDGGRQPVPVSVNLSRVGFYNPKLCEHLYKTAQKYRLPLDLLELEVTETAYASDSRTIHSHIRQLRRMGFKILMDDFGSGYSSLNMLKEAPVDQIKLDMRFLSEPDPYGRAETILQMVIAMGKALSIPVLAEGVETKGQVEMLKSYSCCLAQGYYYARPLTVEKFEEMMDKQTGLSGS